MSDEEKHKLKSSVRLKTDRVHPNSWNPFSLSPERFQALLFDVQDKGQRYPIQVRPCNCGTPEGDHHEITDGESRWLVAQQLRTPEIECYVRELSDVEARFETLNLNYLRGDLVPERFQRLIAELDRRFALPKEKIAMGLRMSVEQLTMKIQPVKQEAEQQPPQRLEARAETFNVSARLHSRRMFDEVNSVLREIMRKEQCDEGMAIYYVFQAYKQAQYNDRK